MKQKQKVYTTGVFDVFHPGHLNLLQEASRLGDELVVGIQEDESVRKQKGRYPVMSCEERMTLVQSLPFVDSVLSYSRIDQRPILRKIQPNILAQGDDWLHTADRTKILKFLKVNNIELRLIPYTKGISSTQIKARVLEQFTNARDDLSKISSTLEIVPIDQLRRYERFDPVRTKKLISKITSDNKFIDPVLVGVYQDSKILIDGANRIESLKQLGIPNVLINKVLYTDPLQVLLTNNEHYINCDPEVFLTSLNDVGISYRKISTQTARKRLFDTTLCAVIEIKNTCYGISGAGDLIDTVHTLNALVKSYIGKCNVVRLSEMSVQSSGYTTKITFRKFTVSDIVTLLDAGAELESGITWHKVRDVFVRVGVPLSLLRNKYAKKETDRKLDQFLHGKLQKGAMRYYPSGVYLCDDWE